MTTLLIDADMILYRACSAVEKDVPFDDTWHILMSSMEDAKGVFYEFLYELKEQAGTDDFVLCYSDPDANFRKKLPGVEYKANRLNMRKPLCYWSLKEYTLRYEYCQLPNLEADDVLGILMTNGTVDDPVLWSLDKDLKQIPGKHLVDDEIIEVTPEDGHLFHMYQTLVGDVADGYKGCPGVGDKAALKYLSELKKPMPYRHMLRSGKRKGEIELRWNDEPAMDMWDTVVSLYERAGLTETNALQQARLAKILDANHYVNGEIKLWKPEP